jgi:crossover junction endodeoxyribonuclease RuvC
MFVLGIDPGLSRCGFGLVQQDRPRPIMRKYGVLSTPHTDELPARLASMLDQMQRLMDTHTPDVVVVERVFFQTNARTAMGVAQASGLALALAYQRGCEVVQYTSNEVKQSITGFGAADKAQVQQMVARMLGLDAIPKPADAADALALALHHLGCAPLTARVASSIGGAGGGLEDRIASSIGGATSGSPFGNARIATSAGGVKISAHTNAVPNSKKPAAKKVVPS